MDKVTQQNAANAEESASASEELSAQAEELNKMVADLRAWSVERLRSMPALRPLRRPRSSTTIWNFTPNSTKAGKTAAKAKAVKGHLTGSRPSRGPGRPNRKKPFRLKAKRH